MKVTVEYLEKMDACPGDVEEFEELFPGGFKPTLKNCLRAAEELDVIWFTERAVTSQARDYFNRRDNVAEKKYDEEEGYYTADLERDRARALFDMFKHYGAKCLRKRPKL